MCCKVFAAARSIFLEAFPCHPPPSQLVQHLCLLDSFGLGCLNPCSESSSVTIRKKGFAVAHSSEMHSVSFSPQEPEPESLVSHQALWPRHYAQAKLGIQDSWPDIVLVRLPCLSRVEAAKVSEVFVTDLAGHDGLTPTFCCTALPAADVLEMAPQMKSRVRDGSWYLGLAQHSAPWIRGIFPSAWQYLFCGNLSRKHKYFFCERFLPGGQTGVLRNLPPHSKPAAGCALCRVLLGTEPLRWNASEVCHVAEVRSSSVYYFFNCSWCSPRCGT